MTNLTRFTVSDNCLRACLVLISFLILVVGLVFPVTITTAAPPPPLGAEKCVGCHPEETDTWRNSTHAHVVFDEGGPIGGTCEACHGRYVVGHPEEGVMQLTVDSSVCENCHTDTFGQWRHSTHAQAGVQCIGCHLSHSQYFRLTEEELCHSCHREHSENFRSTPHNAAGLSCIDCHFPSTPVGEMAFTSDDCAKCHEGAVHQTLGTLHQASTIQTVSSRQTVVEPEVIPELRAKLEIAQQEKKSLQSLSLVYLGLGMGIGGVLGIAFMQVIGYVNRGKVKK